MKRANGRRLEKQRGEGGTELDLSREEDVLVKSAHSHAHSLVNVPEAMLGVTAATCTRMAVQSPWQCIFMILLVVGQWQCD